MVNNGPFAASSLLTNMRLFCAYLFFVYFTIAVVAVPMIYRYLTVCSAYFICIPSAFETAEKLATTIQAHECHDVGEMYIYAIQDIVSAKALLFLTAGAVVTGTYATVIVCVIKLRRTAQKTATGIHRQLHYALLFQASTPLLVIVIPIGGLIFAVFGAEQMRVVAQYCTMALAFIPVFNLLSTIAFIKCYRQSLTKFFVKVTPSVLTSTSRQMTASDNRIACGSTS
ncbi:7TM GPCR protein [Aphelenchoides avenae]|nr:7TM GPCR protein [Aphelenchus avenae]